MENNTVLWITIAAYIICLVVIGIVEGRKAKSIADLTVGGRNAGAWLSALSYGTAYFSDMQAKQVSALDFGAFLRVSEMLFSAHYSHGSY